MLLLWIELGSLGRKLKLWKIYMRSKSIIFVVHNKFINNASVCVDDLNVGVWAPLLPWLRSPLLHTANHRAQHNKLRLPILQAARLEFCWPGQGTRLLQQPWHHAQGCTWGYYSRTVPTQTARSHSNAGSQL